MKHIPHPNLFDTTELRDIGCRKARVKDLASLPAEEWPRERLDNEGPEVLSDQELLAILLNTGIQGKNVLTLAGELLELLDSEPGIPPVRKLSEITGMGKSKACTIAAMLEFGRRRWGLIGARIRHPSQAFKLLRHYADRRQERFLCMSLNGAHEVMASRVVTVGLVNRTIVHPREVFSDVIQDHSIAAIIAHNHPSGDATPSEQDDAITLNLKHASDILGIHLLDHIVFTETTYFSYTASGRMKKLEALKAGVEEAADHIPA
jgi:DNA repair protein RadC